MIGLLLGVVLAVSPAAQGEYTVAVHGGPNANVTLRATGAPRGWVASFCTKSLCSPFSWAMLLDGRGNGTVQLQLIRTLRDSPRRARITVRAPGASPVELVVTR